MRWFIESATTITPLEGITATPAGQLKLAVVPVPSAKEASPLPASVVTTPRGVTSRMRWLSATTITPLEEIAATPYRELKLADVPVPSANASLPLPASVLTTPLLACTPPTPPPTLSTSVWGAAPAPTSPAAPHSVTAENGGAEKAHRTHVLALKATLPPLGSADGALAPATLR